jgi:hypothetical protein
MCLRFIFLLITRMPSWLRPSRREEAWKTAEILILRRQLAVRRRRQPRHLSLTWAGRALLATLLAVIPKARRPGLRLLVTPDTVLRWHRDIARCRRGARSKRGRTGRPATRRNIKALALRLARENPGWGVPPDPRRAGRPGSENSSARGMGNPEQGRDGPCAAADCAHLAAVPALPGRGDPGVRLLHRRPARRHPGVCPGRDRARHQARPHPRSHPASDRGVDRPTDPKPDHGPGRAGAPDQVHDPRPRLKLHGCVRRGPRRCRDPDRAMQRPDAPA